MDSVSSTTLRYVFGEDTIDTILPDGVDPGSLLLVLGHPGAGKTTFAIKMLYENAMRFNAKALYIGFAETKEKFYSYMKRFNIDLELAENKGLFTFIQMPTMSGKELLEAVTSILSEKIFGEGYSIVVVDSITPILNVLTTDEARAYLHTALYNLVSTTRVLLILIADLPFATETVDLKGLEFIADAVFVFKTRIEKGLIHRFTEIRKFRGRPIPMAELPFAIEEGRGVKVLTSPSVLQTPYIATMMSYKDECSNIVWGSLYTGTYVGVISECRVIPLSIWTLVIRLVYGFGLTYGIISFKEPPDVMRNILSDIAKSMNYPSHYILQKIVFIENINPAAYSTQQIDAILRNYIEQNVNIIVLVNTESLYLYHDPLLVDRILNILSLYTKSGLTIIFEFIDNVYTQSQLMRYDITHKISCIDESIIHSVIRSRIIGLDIRSSRAVAKIGDKDIVDCIEQHPLA